MTYDEQTTIHGRLQGLLEKLSGLSAELVEVGNQLEDDFYVGDIYDAADEVEGVYNKIQNSVNDLRREIEQQKRYERSGR